MMRMFVLPPNLYVEILTPKDDGIRRWGSWEVPKSGGRAFPNEISVLTKEIPKQSLAPSPT